MTHKIYLSGPISALPLDEARDNFRRAGEIIKQKFAEVGSDVEIVNPMVDSLPAESEWEAHIGFDIARLQDCDTIVLLPGWESSKGAKIEQNYARFSHKIEYRLTNDYKHLVL